LKKISSFTGHGFPQIFSAESLYAKIIWFLLVVLFFSLNTMYIYDSVSGYFQYDVISNIKIIQKNELTFPAIVFCSWYSSVPITEAIVFCTFNQVDCESSQVEFEPITVIGYGLSKMHSCIRINGQKISMKHKKKLMSVTQHGVYEAGLSIGFAIPDEVCSIF